MCGRFALFAPASQIADTFRIAEPVAWTPRFNIAPTQSILAVIRDERGRHAEAVRWGLIPSWSKDPKIAYRLINARSETADAKPSFRSAFRSRRALIPMSCFYEWVHEGKQKLPFRIDAPDSGLLAAAGLYEDWRGEGPEAVRTATILTTGANGDVARIHDRMPVILSPDQWEAWLDPAGDADAARAVLAEPRPPALRARRVSTDLNNVRNEGPRLIEPIEDPGLFG